MFRNVIHFIRLVTMKFCMQEVLGSDTILQTGCADKRVVVFLSAFR